jgi:hypothetical protein
MPHSADRKHRTRIQQITNEDDIVHLRFAASRVCSSSSKEVQLLPLASGFYAWWGAMGGFFAILELQWPPEGGGRLRRPLHAGEIATTGTLTEALPAMPGELWQARQRH